MHARTGLYRDADIYDILHAPGTAAEVDGLERIARRWLPPSRRTMTWLEPACGTGRYLRRLAARGHRVVGFDRDKEMVAYARARIGEEMRRNGQALNSRGAHIFVGEMTAFAARIRAQVDIAFNLINTIRHLGSDRATLAHLREVRATLREGGVYAVGISLTAYGVEFPSEDVWMGSRGRVRVKQVVQYLPPESDLDRFERVFSHLAITRGKAEEHRDSEYRLRCYSRRQWEEIIRRSGFALEAVVDERGDKTPVRPFGYGVWLLRK